MSSSLQSEASRSPASNLPHWQEVRAPHGLGYRIRLMAQLMSRLF